MLGLASFPGISQLVRASFTLSHGITPSVATLVIAPQADFLPWGERWSSPSATCD